MRYLTRDLQLRRQFFIFMAGRDFTTLSRQESERLSQSFRWWAETYRDDMLRLLPGDLRDDIFDPTGNLRLGLLDEATCNKLAAYNSALEAEEALACRAVEDEHLRINPRLPMGVRDFLRRDMRYQLVTGVSRVGTELHVMLQERCWGRPYVVFKSVSKHELSDTLFPAHWKCDEIFGLTANRYEYNIMFHEGELSVVCGDMAMRSQTWHYVGKLFAECTPAATRRRYAEAADRLTEKNIPVPQWYTDPNAWYEDFYEALTSAVRDKYLFAPHRLSEAEREILFFDCLLSRLLHPQKLPDGRTLPSGFHGFDGLSSGLIQRAAIRMDQLGIPSMRRLFDRFAASLQEPPSTRRMTQEKLTRRFIRIYGLYKGDFRHPGLAATIYKSIFEYVSANAALF